MASNDQDVDIVGPSDSATLEQKLDSATGSPTAFYLLMMRGPQPGRLCRITSERTTIGRSPESHIQIDEGSVSSFHAKLVFKRGECWVMDLGSTNGTFINEERVLGTVALRIGDALRVGSNVFACLAESEPGKAGSLSLTRDQSGTLTRGTPLALPAGHSTGSLQAADPDAGPTLLDWVDRGRKAMTYVKRYAWLLVVFACLGVAAGFAHARLRPPGGEAYFQVALRTEASDNPIDEDRGRPKSVIFSSAEQTFGSLLLIRRTLERLGMPKVSDGDAAAVKERLSFKRAERLSDVFQGKYEAASVAEARAFLQTHLEVYLESELEKTLHLIQTQGEFLAQQVAEAGRELSTIEQKMAELREKHPEIMMLFSERVAANQPQMRAGSAKDALASSLSATRQEIAILRKQLDQGDSLLVDRVKDAEAFNEEIAKTKAKIAQAKAEGLTDQHPEVKRLNGHVAELERLAMETIAAQATEVEKRTNAEYRKTLAQLEQLQRTEDEKSEKLRALEKEKAKEAKPEEKKMSLAEVESRYIELDREQTNAQNLYEALRTKLKANQLQVELERVAANSRYDIITPTTGAHPNMKLAFLMRSGIGGALGIVLAVIIAGFIELRRYIREADARSLTGRRA